MHGVPVGRETVPASETVPQRVADLEERYVELIDTIRSDIGQDSRIVMVGYPQLIHAEHAGLEPECILISGGERDWMRSQVPLLNLVIERASLTDHDSTYVDLVPIYDGKEACNPSLLGETYLNGINIEIPGCGACSDLDIRIAGSFHPKPEGHAATAPAVGSSLVQPTTTVDDLVVLPQPCPIYDSQSASGALLGPVPGGTTRTVVAAGLLPPQQGVQAQTCVPAGATSVIYTISAVEPAGSGNLRLSKEGVVANGGVVNYAASSLNNANTVTVPLGPSGNVDIFANVSAADIRLTAIGYYASGGNLRYTPVTPCAVADSRSNQGPGILFAGPFAAGAAYPDIDVTATFSAAQGGGNTDCGIPDGVEAVVINLVAVSATGGSGYLAIGTGGTDPISEPATPFAAIGMNNAATAVVPLGPGGTLAIDIEAMSGSPTTQIRAVVMGYLTTQGGYQYTAVNPCAAFDSRPNQDPTGGFAGARRSGSTGVTTYQIAGGGLSSQGGRNGGSCGVPLDAKAALVNLVAVNASQGGNLRAYATGSSPSGGLLNFAALTPAMNNSNAVIVPLSGSVDGGKIDVFVNTWTNDGSEVTHVRGVVLGYYR